MSNKVAAAVWVLNSVLLDELAFKMFPDHPTPFARLGGFVSGQPPQNRSATTKPYESQSLLRD